MKGADSPVIADGGLVRTSPKVWCHSRAAVSVGYLPRLEVERTKSLCRKKKKKPQYSSAASARPPRGSSKIVVNLDWSEWHKDVCPSWGSQRARQTKATIVADKEMSSAPRWIVQRRRVRPTPRAWRWLRFRPIVASGRTIDVQGAAGRLHTTTRIPNLERQQIRQFVSNGLADM